MLRPEIVSEWTFLAESEDVICMLPRLMMCRLRILIIGCIWCSGLISHADWQAGRRIRLAAAIQNEPAPEDAPLVLMRQV